MKIFSREKYFECYGGRKHSPYDIIAKPWVDACEGAEVYEKDGLSLMKGSDGLEYMCDEDWCIEAPDKEITIQISGRVTTATLIVNGKPVKKAIAKCSPYDKPNLKVGAELALERLFEKEEKIEKIITVGSRVKVVNIDGFHKDVVPKGIVGEIGTVKAISYWFNKGSIAVEFDKPIKGCHAGGAFGDVGKWGYCYNLDEKNLKLV